MHHYNNTRRSVLIILVAAFAQVLCAAEDPRELERAERDALSNASEVRTLINSTFMPRVLARLPERPPTAELPVDSAGNITFGVNDTFVLPSDLFVVLTRDPKGSARLRRIVEVFLYEYDAGFGKLTDEMRRGLQEFPSAAIKWFGDDSRMDIELLSPPELDGRSIMAYVRKREAMSGKKIGVAAHDWPSMSDEELRTRLSAVENKLVFRYPFHSERENHVCTARGPEEFDQLVREYQLDPVLTPKRCSSHQQAAAYGRQTSYESATFGRDGRERQTAQEIASSRAFRQTVESIRQDGGSVAPRVVRNVISRIATSASDSGELRAKLSRFTPSSTSKCGESVLDPMHIMTCVLDHTIVVPPILTRVAIAMCRDEAVNVDLFALWLKRTQESRWEMMRTPESRHYRTGLSVWDFYRNKVANVDTPVSTITLVSEASVLERRLAPYYGAAAGGSAAYGPKTLLEFATGSFWDCVETELEFSVAHEIGHIATARDGHVVNDDEDAADCWALKHARRRGAPGFLEGLVLAAAEDPSSGFLTLTNAQTVALRARIERLKRRSCQPER